VVALLAVMLGGIEINIAKVKLKTTTKRSDLDFLLAKLRIALDSIPNYFTSLKNQYETLLFCLIDQ
jgi:hypothetical protein